MAAAALQEESQLQVFTKNLLPSELLNEIMAASQKKQVRGGISAHCNQLCCCNAQEALLRSLLAMQGCVLFII
jgi:hypothetical protein